MRKLKLIKRFSEEQPNRPVKVLSVIILVFSMLVLISYYFDILTKLTDIIIIILALSLSADSFLYLHHTKKYKLKYRFLGTLFLLVALTHISRLLLGPAQCLFSRTFLSLYLYDGIAALIGLSLLYLSIALMRKRSGPRYHHLAGILFGAAMLLNHIIKIVVGKCV